MAEEFGNGTAPKFQPHRESSARPIPVAPTPEPTPNEARFWSSVEKTDTCWLWTARTYWDGYGAFYVGGRTVRAHRWAYESLVGPIPDGLVLDHLCRVRWCVNPAHLEPATNRENLLRGEGPASRTECPRGHEYTTKGDGTRYCRACQAEVERSRRATGKTRWTCPVCGKTVANRSRHSKTHREA